MDDAVFQELGFDVAVDAAQHLGVKVLAVSLVYDDDVQELIVVRELRGYINFEDADLAGHVGNQVGFDDAFGSFLFRDSDSYLVGSSYLGVVFNSRSPDGEILKGDAVWGHGVVR